MTTISTATPTPTPNPWVVQEAKQFQPVPVGMYLTTYVGVEAITLNNENKWRWKWKVTTGEYAGREVSALTNQSISPSQLAGRLIAGMLGRALIAGENVQDAIGKCAGMAYMVHFASGPKGGKPQVQLVGKPPQM
jgi:hypothetical protein